MKGSIYPIELPFPDGFALMYLAFFMCSSICFMKRLLFSPSPCHATVAHSAYLDALLRSVRELNVHR